MKTDADAVIEEALAELRRNPQTERLWRRNLDFRRFVRRWKDWRVLAASDLLPAPLLAARGCWLEKEWAGIESFFVRYEADRFRLNTLHEAHQTSRGPAAGDGTRPESLFKGLDREWTRLEKEVCFSGDPGLFAQLEDLLDIAEARLRPPVFQTPAATENLPSLESAGRVTPPDLRGQAKRLLGESMLLIRQLDLGAQTRGLVMQDRRHILELLENGESACAFWWSKDLHAWLTSISDERRSSHAPWPDAGSASCGTRHARFTEIQTRLKNLLRGESPPRSSAVQPAIPSR